MYVDHTPTEGVSMFVSVTTRLNIDTDSWTMNYGIEGKKDIRDDVKAYVDNLVREHLRDLGLTKEEDPYNE
jgi:hypothetical protein